MNWNRYPPGIEAEPSIDIITCQRALGNFIDTQVVKRTMSPDLKQRRMSLTLSAQAALRALVTGMMDSTLKQKRQGRPFFRRSDLFCSNPFQDLRVDADHR
jgi:hypothetical protein